nr:N-acetyltransferase [uncultured Brevundimonas sp.]
MLQAAALSIDPLVQSETARHGHAVDALVEAAFGPGRYAKTAERLREGARPAAGFVVETHGRVTGAVRLWPITIGGTPALFLGPIAVDAGQRGDGQGAALVQACLDHARANSASGVLLVGDPSYFQRFGFVAAPDAALPGPVDPRRVLWAPVMLASAAGAVRAG